MRSSTSKAISAKIVITTPMIQSCAYSTINTPASSSRLPTTRMTNCEKKFERAVTSASMRSINSPGVRALWNVISSRRQCRATSARSSFVAFQPMPPPMYVAPIEKTRCTTATPMKISAIVHSVVSSPPDVAVSMKLRRINGLTISNPMLVNSSTDSSAMRRRCVLR